MRMRDGTRRNNFIFECSMTDFIGFKKKKKKKKVDMLIHLHFCRLGFILAN
jgi:hypothetical protein